MDFPSLPPLTVRSLKEECSVRLENLILSGGLQIGQRLPSERDLARHLGVSRPVLHEAIVDMAGKGLVTISPRRGVFVNDFRITGSFPLLTTLMRYHEGGLDLQLLDSLVNFRHVVETEIARLAARNITGDQLEQLQVHVDLEQESLDEPVDILISLDFDFHFMLALASHNLLYPLIFNSCKGIYTNLTGTFFTKCAGTPRIEENFDYHARIVDALAEEKAEEAAGLMASLLKFGIDSMVGED